METLVARMRSAISKVGLYRIMAVIGVLFLILGLFLPWFVLRSVAIPSVIGLEIIVYGGNLGLLLAFLIVLLWILSLLNQSLPALAVAHLLVVIILFMILEQRYITEIIFTNRDNFVFGGTVSPLGPGAYLSVFGAGQVAISEFLAWRKHRTLSVKDSNSSPQPQS